MAPKLIFALDTIRVNQVSLARRTILGGVDIIEVGTPLIKISGLKIVELLHKKYPNVPIYADLKVMDFPEMEVIDFFEAGALFVSIMAFANNNTILKAFELAKSYDRKIFVSLMGYPECELKKRVKELSKLGTEYIIAHGSGEPEDAFRDTLRKIKLVHQIDDVKLIAAGGINESNIDSILRYHPKIIIIGRGISMQEDITSAVMRVKEKILNYQNSESGDHYVV
jgi:3-hexulose-6-phosphate synthase